MDAPNGRAELAGATTHVALSVPDWIGKTYFPYTPRRYMMRSCHSFEYVCSECGRTDQKLVRTPAPEHVRCGACGGQASRQVPVLARSAVDRGPTPSSGT
jgi:hypothetical protein